MMTIKSKRARDVLRIVIPFLLIPLAVVVGTLVFDEKKHLFVSFFVALLSVILFVSGFERKITGSRRMVIVAVMIALSVVGRFIPFFKPITAITVITAVYLGGETGFIVGAFSALLSNFYFGQGPWTAFQMLAWGLIGLFAGFMAKRLQKSKILLCLYGVLSGIAYSLIMDLWTMLSYGEGISTGVYFGLVITALPHTVTYALSNFVFLWFMAKPFGEKLNRIKIKYGV